MTATTTTNNGSDYIDLHTTGLGFISRVELRTTTGGRKKVTFMRATINAMHGKKDADDGIQYARFDVRAISGQSMDVLKQIQDDANNKDLQVSVRFKIGDLMPEVYFPSQGKNAGKPVATICGRLLLVSHVWVKDRSSGEKRLVYSLPHPTASAASGSDLAQQA